jgi:hypothetical protein
MRNGTAKRNSEKVVRCLILALLTACIHTACSQTDGEQQDAGTPGRRQYLTEQQVEAEEAKANAGDVKAITRLVNHYQWATSDEEKVRFWLRKGVESGDHLAMINLSSKLSAEGSQRSCREAEALLNQVLISRPEPDKAKIANSYLKILREGVDGSGSCMNWLGTNSGAQQN